jgi:hypothetical protein
MHLFTLALTDITTLNHTLISTLCPITIKFHRIRILTGYVSPVIIWSWQITFKNFLSVFELVLAHFELAKKEFSVFLLVICLGLDYIHSAPEVLSHLRSVNLYAWLWLGLFFARLLQFLRVETCSLFETHSPYLIVRLLIGVRNSKNCIILVELWL